MTPTSTSSRTPGWYPDPRGRGKRYWDGHGWTNMKRANDDRSRTSGGGAWVGISGSSRSTSGY